MVSFDPNRPDFAPYGFTCERWTPSPMRRPDHHNEVEINFLRTGWLIYLLGGGKVRVDAGRLSVFWAAIPHQIIEFGTQTEYFVATIPFAWILQCKFPEKFLQPLLRGEMHREQTAARAESDQHLFEEWEENLIRPQKETTRIVMLEMEARLLRLTAALPNINAGKKHRARHSVIDDGALNKVERMACLIAQRYTEHLAVEEIGHAVGLHPNYAMSLFKKAFGTTLVEYLTHHRVSHAQRLLATTDNKIVEIAFSSGFNSISRFNEAFRGACGCTPREYRIRHEATE